MGTSSNSISFWKEHFKEEVEDAMWNIKQLSPAESDCIFSLIIGGQYNSGLNSGSQAITSTGEVVTILGFSDKLGKESIFKDVEADKVA